MTTPADASATATAEKTELKVAIPAGGAGAGAGAGSGSGPTASTPTAASSLAALADELSLDDKDDMKDAKGGTDSKNTLGKKKKKVVVKVGMVGDSQIGKTSLMVKYVEGNFNEDYIQTLGKPALRAEPSQLTLITAPWVFTGVNFMEKTISLRNTDITFSIWDLGGACAAPPLTCVCDAAREELIVSVAGRPTRVPAHAAAGVQRRGRAALHVRPVAQIDADQRQELVQAGALAQQGESNTLLVQGSVCAH